MSSKLKIHLIFWLIFIALFFFFILNFAQYGVRTDPDTHSYAYLFQEKPDVYSWRSRPPVYPLFFWFTNSLDHLVSANSPSPHLLANYALRSLAITGMSYLLYRLTQKMSLALILVLILTFNLNLLQRLNFTNPEILLNFLVMLHAWTLYKLYGKEKKIDSRYIILVIASMFLLTFTKPIFLYYPLIQMPLIWWFIKTRNTKQRLRVRSLAVSFLTLLALYIVPVSMRVIQNYQAFATPTFSPMFEKIIAGKVMQYRLADKGPSESKYQVLREKLWIDREHKSIFARLEEIQATMEEPWKIDGYIGEFSKQTIWKNMPEYLIKSAKLLPTILLQYDFRTLESLPPFFETVHIFTNFIFFWYYPLSLPLIIVGIVLIVPKQRYFLVAVSGFWLYSLLTLALTAYDSYPRLRSTQDDLFFLLIMISFWSVGRKIFSVLESYERKHDRYTDKSTV